MKKILFLLCAIVLAAGVMAGCGGGGDDEKDNPFKGTWNVPAFGVNVTLTDDTWTIQGVGSGAFSYQGDYPDYVVTLDFQGDAVSGTAHFNDDDQFVGCFQGDCATFNRI